MKWIVYSLLLINIAVFVWYFQREDESALSTNEANDDQAALSLVLLKEFNQDKQDNPDNTGLCMNLGPFTNSKQASLAAKILDTELNINAEVRMRKEARRKAYWVLLPPAESKELARQNIQRLKQLKVRDYFLVVTGDQVNAVSLGVFTQFESANRRIKQIQEMGFTPKWERVELPKKEYWLEWSKITQQSVPDVVLIRLRKLQEGVELKERGCQ